MSKNASYNSKNLDAIRKRIDALDDRIHDTLMERAALVLKIGEEKKKKDIQIVQPAREARMIRRLLGRHEGSLPEKAVVRIWRELVGAVSLLQTGLSVSVAVPEGGHGYWDLARDYFGSCLPIHKAPSALSAVGALREGKANFAVVPWPDMEEANPWWALLEEGTAEEASGTPVKILAALPHGREGRGKGDGAAKHEEQRALVIGRFGFDESGEDCVFLLLRCSPEISRGGLVDIAKKEGLEALGLYSWRAPGAEGGGSTRPGLHLMEVAGFIGQDDPRLEKLRKRLNSPEALCLCVGGYPVPPVYRKSGACVPRESEETASPPPPPPPSARSAGSG